MKMTEAQTQKLREITYDTKRRLRMHGIDVDVVITVEGVSKSPYEMAECIEQALGFKKDSYKLRTSDKSFVMLRMVCAVLIKRFYPSITMVRLGKMLSGLHHTTIIAAMKDANELILKKDYDFYPKYSTALKAVERWARSE